MGEWIVLLDRFRRPLSAIRPSRSGMLPMKGASPSRLASTAAAGGVALRTSIHSGEQSGFVHDEMGNTAERESCCRTQARNPALAGMEARRAPGAGLVAGLLRGGENSSWPFGSLDSRFKPVV